jgi:post-segregation antitoxin (ccd killing protein)
VNAIRPQSRYSKQKRAAKTAKAQTREARWQQWRQENAAAIRAYNKYVEREGTLSERLRREE